MKCDWRFRPEQATGLQLQGDCLAVLLQASPCHTNRLKLHRSPSLPFCERPIERNEPQNVSCLKAKTTQEKT
ncbi:MAG TPA: hypothetical protein DDW52_14165 [Planctomycetaceae bacterium]|nr:hypothetical protein [Planctomycetaceae bacterium]